MNEFASLPLVRALGWALCHSLWQGGALGLLAAGLLRAARHRPPEFRYRLASIALGLIVLAFAGTVFWLLPHGAVEISPEDGLFAPIFETGAVAGRWAQFHLLATPWMPWLLLAWGLGLCLRLLKLGGGLVWLYGPCLGAAEPAPAEWQTRFDRVRRETGVHTSVRLGLSWEVDSLLVLGWFKPVILVPGGALLALPPEALEALLAHEFAHICRGDFLANLIQTLAESILFYHPAVWWLSRRIRQEREHCCDDAAVQACGDPILYASALLGLEELRTQPKLIPDLALAASGGKLMSRIQRLLRPHHGQDPAAPLAIILPALLLVATLGIATLSASDTAKSAPPAAAPVEVDFSKIRVKFQPDAPQYPPEAKAQRIQGTVVVLVVIDPQGKVQEVKATSGPEELHACAEGYAKRWEFEPAKVKGKPVAARFKLTMPFRLR